MSKGISNPDELRRAMRPVLHDGAYAWCVLPHDAVIDGLAPVVTVREAEGLTIIVPEQTALSSGLPVRFRAAWITLQVHSDLEAVGLTASFSTALAQAGISCNVVAGVFHDHIFVPAQLGERALDVLRRMALE